MKSEIIYFDDNKKITTEENAKTAVIRELDDDGNLVKETWGYIEPPISDEKLNDMLMKSIKK